MNYALIIISLILSTLAQAEMNSPIRSSDFSQHTRIHLTNSEAFHQITLPVAVYQSLQREDLGDIRVFNGEGEVLPYALLYPDTTSTSNTQEISVPIFPIAATSKQHEEDNSVEIRRNADGTLISIRQSNRPQPESASLRGALLDISQLTDESYALRLEIEASTHPFHPFTLESSDDLQEWHPLTEGQLVHLQHGNHNIEKNTVEWRARTGKYLRILWTHPEKAPRLTRAWISTVHTTRPIPALIWSQAFTPHSSEKNIYDYAIQGYFPLERIRFHLAQINTLAAIQLQKNTLDLTPRHKHRYRWETLRNAVIFRLQSSLGDVISPDIMLNAPAEKQLRLVVDDRSGGLGTAPPTLQIGFTPHTLIFLARGKPPFTLAWGSTDIPSAALPIETLVPNEAIYQGIDRTSATLAPITLVAAKEPSLKQSASEPINRRYILWAALIGGVLVLAGMVWKLITQIKKTE